MNSSPSQKMSQHEHNNHVIDDDPLSTIHHNVQQTQQHKIIPRSKLCDLDLDTLELVLSYFTGASEIESLKYSCRNLFRMLSGGWNLLGDDCKLTSEIEENIMEMYSNNRINERMENMYLPRVYLNVAFGVEDNTQSRIDSEEEELENPSLLLQQFIELFGKQNCKQIAEFEVEVVIDWEQSDALLECLDGIYGPTPPTLGIDDDNNDLQSNITKPAINMTYHAKTEEKRQKLINQHVTIKDRLKKWRSQYPTLLTCTKKMTANPFRVFKKFILHIHITEKYETTRGIPRESIIRLNNRRRYYALFETVDSYIIDLYLGVVVEHYKRVLAFRKLTIWRSSLEEKLKDVAKISLYVFFYFRLIPIMDKCEIPLKKVYSDVEMNYLSRLLQHGEIPKIYKFLTLHQNLICRYRRQIMNKKIALPSIKEVDYERGQVGSLAMINYFNLVSFDTMNDNQRIHFVRTALQHIYKSELSISDEWREKYFTQFGIGKDDEIQVERPLTNEQLLLTFTFQTLEFDRTTTKMKHNIFSLPRYPQVSVSSMSHTRPSDKRLFHVTAGIGTLDKCCVEKWCDVPLLSLCNCSCILCCWCMTSCCCYKTNNFIGNSLRSCGYPYWMASLADLCCCVSHRILPSLDLSFCCDVYNSFYSTPSGKYYTRYSQWEEHDHF